jgi:hypothetical protein
MTEKTDENATMAAIAEALEAEGLAAADVAMGTAASAEGLFEQKFAPGGPSPGIRDIAAEVTGKLFDPQSVRVSSFPEWMAQQPQPGVIPLSDLRERIAILVAAGVTRYRDAGVELQFDPEAQNKDGRTEPKTERF